MNLPWVPMIWLLSLTLLQPGNARGQSRDREDQTHDDFLILQQRLDALQAQQQQLLDQLNEMKRLLPTFTSPRPNPQLPTTLNIRGEDFRGDSPARVVIVEYSDFECPYCRKYERETSPQILESYIKTGKVKLFYRDLPGPTHPHAMSAARAARCAGEQGKYWEMHDSLYAKQTGLSDPALVDRAQKLELDATKFTECLSGKKYADELQNNVAEAEKMGIDGTPTFFLGTIGSDDDVVSISKKIDGARPYQAFQSILDELLASKSPAAADH
jgi:protein-disulfide isomerase